VTTGGEDDKTVLADSLEAEFRCTHDCAVSTVEEFYPDEAKCRAVVQAKMKASYVVLVGFVSKQREHFDNLCADLRSAFAHFPLLNGSMPVDADTKSADAKASVSSCVDWSLVRKALFAKDKAPLMYQHAKLANVGVPNDLAVLENAYRTLAIKEGFFHLMGCYAAGDGVVTAMDYVNERLCGTPMQELARRMRFEPEVVAALNGVEANIPTSAQTHVNAFGNNPGTSHSKRQDKGSAQAALRDAGLAYIRSVVTTNSEEAVAHIRDGTLLLPVVVKPSTGAGSEFVTLCYTESAVTVAFEMVAGMQTSQGTDAEVLVVEEYIEGPEYVVNTVSYNGVAVVTDVWQSWKYPQDVFTTGMSYAAELNLPPTSLQERKRNKTSILYDKQTLFPDLASLPPDHEARQVAEYTLQCLDALELRNGCAHCELRVDMRDAAARRRRNGQQHAGAAAKRSPHTAVAVTSDEDDEGGFKGEPVLIELNPRMQGDAPRSTEVVGYDQFSLMVYIGEAVNTFGGATTVSTQRPFRVASPESSSSSPAVRGEIPWPPVPRFYHALDSSNPPCTTVLFLVASSDCILNGLALPYLTSLLSFERFTRTIFKANLPGYVTSLRQTVDLFSSPSACVMRGSPEQVEADCKTIRAMEVADVTDVTKSMLQDVISQKERVRLMHLALRNAERHLEYAKEAVNNDRPRTRLNLVCDPVAGEAAEADLSAPNHHQALIAEAQQNHDTLAESLMETKMRLEDLQEAVKVNMRSQSPPPLYIGSSTFDLLKRSDLGWMLSVL
jgi:biotin carboxylase